MKKKKKVKHSLALNLAMALFFTNIAPQTVMKMGYQHNCNQNAVRYESEINEYEQYVNDYASYIHSLKLETDIEVIFKVIKDIWSSIEGYDVAEDLPMGYYRLAFQEEGKGVCTSFADDFTARMNAINPEYDAENVYVYLNAKKKDGKIPTVELERKVLHESTSTAGGNEKILNKVLGNHMVSIIKIPGKNINLIVDPTNLFIGVFKDGTIEVLNSLDNDFMEYKMNVNLICSLENLSQNLNEYFSSFSTNDMTNEELYNDYRLKAQEDAYKKISRITLEPQILSKTLR